MSIACPHCGDGIAFVATKEARTMISVPGLAGRNATAPSDMLTLDIVLASSDGFSVPRMSRLFRVMEYLLAARPSTLAKVSGLRDWKGDLLVVWKDRPSAADTGAVSMAWEAVHEDGDSVYHEVMPASTREDVKEFMSS